MANDSGGKRRNAVREERREGRRILARVCSWMSSWISGGFVFLLVFSDDRI